ncbi:uncharacterized protein LOC104265733 [Ciona intestinalis]
MTNLPENLLHFLSSFKLKEKSLEYNVDVKPGRLKLTLEWIYEESLSREEQALNVADGRFNTTHKVKEIDCAKRKDSKNGLNTDRNEVAQPKSFQSTHTVVLAKRVGLHTKLDRATAITSGQWCGGVAKLSRASVEDDESMTQHHVTIEHARIMSQDDCSTIEADSDWESVFSVSSLDSVATDDNYYEKSSNKNGSNTQKESNRLQNETGTTENASTSNDTEGVTDRTENLSYIINKRTLSPIHEGCDDQRHADQINDDQERMETFESYNECDLPSQGFMGNGNTGQTSVKLTEVNEEQLMKLYKGNAQDIIIIRASKFRLPFEQLKNLTFGSGLIDTKDVVAVFYDDKVMKRPGYLIQFHPKKRDVQNKLLDITSEERCYGVLKLVAGDEIRMTSFDPSFVE